MARRRLARSVAVSLLVVGLVLVGLASHWTLGESGDDRPIAARDEQLRRAHVALLGIVLPGLNEVRRVVPGAQGGLTVFRQCRVVTDSGDAQVRGPSIGMNWVFRGDGKEARDRTLQVLRANGWVVTGGDHIGADDRDLRKDVDGGAVYGQLLWSRDLPDEMLLTVNADLPDACPRTPDG